MTAALDPGDVLCLPFLSAFPIGGVSISVVSDRGASSTVGASDEIAVRLDELQFRLGEGPAHDVLRTGRPAVDTDLCAASAQQEWPVFSAAAVAAGARELFTLPLLVGRSAVGVVTMYAAALLPPWSTSELRVASGLAESTAHPAIRLATRAAESDLPLLGEGPTELHREVHQATGMISVQLDCGIAEALVRLRAYAFAHGMSADDVARSVVARTLRFTNEDD